MRRLTLMLVGLASTANLGCHLNNRVPQAQPACGEAHVSCGACSAGTDQSGCTLGKSVESRRGEFGLFGTIFCDPRLSEGTACWPWQYAYNLCEATSQFSNTVLGGDPDESLSSRFGRAQQDGVLPVRYGLAPVTNLLVGPNHCRRCIESEQCHKKEVWAW